MVSADAKTHKKVNESLDIDLSKTNLSFLKFFDQESPIEVDRNLKVFLPHLIKNNIKTSNIMKKLPTRWMIKNILKIH